VNPQATELARYVVNGLVATAVHFAVLSFNLKVWVLPSAGVANFIAAFFGIATSFVGSRYFVFKKRSESIFSQAIKFACLYGVIAILHGLVLYCWTDRWGYDYRLGFLLATLLQISLSYVGNKTLVFNK
jgi:putative flippase GtrA